eukprot:m.246074 g.246074  ORF g.246074 m.246074 type:complete len:359 (+) comp40869_c0_seq1:67-1143(+)
MAERGEMRKESECQRRDQHPPNPSFQPYHLRPGRAVRVEHQQAPGLTKIFSLAQTTQGTILIGAQKSANILQLNPISLFLHAEQQELLPVPLSDAPTINFRFLPYPSNSQPALIVHDRRSKRVMRVQYYSKAGKDACAVQGDAPTPSGAEMHTSSSSTSHTHDAPDHEGADETTSLSHLEVNILWTFPLPETSGARSMALLPDGNVVLVESNGLRFLCGETGRELSSVAYQREVPPMHFITAACVDPQTGLLVVVDERIDRPVVLTLAGQLSTAITLGLSHEGPGPLDDPLDIIVDRRGNILVADFGAERVTVFARDGSVNHVMLPGTPRAVLVDQRDRLLVALCDLEYDDTNLIVFE